MRRALSSEPVGDRVRDLVTACVSLLFFPVSSIVLPCRQKGESSFQLPFRAVRFIAARVREQPRAAQLFAGAPHCAGPAGHPAFPSKQLLGHEPDDHSRRALRGAKAGALHTPGPLVRFPGEVPFLTETVSSSGGASGRSGTPDAPRRAGAGPRERAASWSGRACGERQLGCGSSCVAKRLVCGGGRSWVAANAQEESHQPVQSLGGRCHAQESGPSIHSSSRSACRGDRAVPSP